MSNNYDIQRKFMDLLALYNTKMIVEDSNPDEIDFEISLTENLSEVLHQMEIYILNKIASKLKRMN